jgi:hypothetical protein
MRRPLILVALASAALVVGCGSSKTASAPQSPVTTALSYVPAGIGAKIIGMLGDLTGWSAAGPSGITGAATVTFR